MIEPAPTTTAGADGLRTLLAEPDQALIALDFDGTLSPIVADPAQARPAPGASDVLRRLATQVGTLAIVTGRPAAVAVELLGFAGDGFANVVVLGHYGLECWTPGTGVARIADADVAGVADVRLELPALLSAVGAPAGTSIEDKGESVAVHVRRTADPAGALDLLRDPLATMARSHGLRLEPGRMVLELRPAGIDKGIALENLVRERGVTAVCYAGDDVGDLAAFDAIDRLRGAGIRGLAICCGCDDVPELATRADLVLGGPAVLVTFLNDIADAIEHP